MSGKRESEGGGGGGAGGGGEKKKKTLCVYFYFLSSTSSSRRTFLAEAHLARPPYEASNVPFFTLSRLAIFARHRPLALLEPTTRERVLRAGANRKSCSRCFAF